MKLFHVIAGCAMIALAACTSAHKDSYTIKGSLAGLPDSAVIVLSDATANTTDQPLAEVVLVDGKFEINGVSPEPRLVRLHVKDTYGSHTFMIENADIEIAGDVTSEEANDGKTLYGYKNVNVKGSSSNDEYLVKTLGRRQLDTAFIAYQNEFADVREVLFSIPRNDPRRDSVMATDRYKEMAATEKGLFAALDSNYHATVEANKDSFWGPLLMYSMVTYLSPQNREMYEQFSDSAKNSYYGRFVYDKLYPVGRPGDKMPEIKAVTTDGNEVVLTEFCKGKKAVLLDFWASWCGPCRREIPNLKEIYKKYADKGFDILSISIDAEEEPWLKAVKDEDLKWTNVRDTDKSIADQYKVSAVPTMYVLDGNGCLVAENLRGAELAAKIAEIID